MPLLYSSSTTLPPGRRQIGWRRDVIVVRQDPTVLPFLQPAGSVNAAGFTCLLLTLPLPPLTTEPSIVCRILPRPPANPDRLHCRPIVVFCDPGPSRSSLSPTGSIYAMGFVFCLLLPLLLPPSCRPPDPPVPTLQLSLSSTNCYFSRVCHCRQPTPGGAI